MEGHTLTPAKTGCSYLAKTRRDVFYIFTHSMIPGVCKPGTTGWIKKRQQTLRGSFPFGEAVLAYSIETPHYRTIEKMVKSNFKSRQLNGDWINVTPEEVIAFVQTIPLVGEQDV